MNLSASPVVALRRHGDFFAVVRAHSHGQDGGLIGTSWNVFVPLGSVSEPRPLSSSHSFTSTPCQCRNRTHMVLYHI